jgi:hypothetical protein
MGAATSVYKDELYGDATQTIALCSLYDQQVAMQQSKISLMKYKKEPISDKRFRTELEVETEAEKSTRWMDKVVSVEEQELASMVDRVFDSSERVNSSESDTADVANDVVLQFNEIGLEGGDDDDDGDNDVDESSNTSGGADSVVIIGHGPKKRKVRVRKAKVNALAFTDVIKCAKDKLANRNLTVSRHRRLIREDKERNRKKNLNPCHAWCIFICIVLSRSFSKKTGFSFVLE